MLTGTTVTTINLIEGKPGVTLTAYVAGTSGELAFNEKRKAMLVIPGGAYAFCSDREADPIAHAYLAAGFNTFILRYSVYRTGNPVWPSPLVDASAAMKYIRDHAEELHIDPDFVFVIGFSAGGHLAASLGTLWDNDEIEKQLGFSKGYNRPTGMILAYAVLSGLEYAHRGSIDNILGEHKEEEAALFREIAGYFAAAVPAVPDADITKLAELILHEAFRESGGATLHPELPSLMQELRKILPEAPVIALTATATPQVAEDIMEKLCFREKLLLKSGFERPNLSYVVRHTEDKLGQLLNICGAVPGTGIVYMRNRRKCEEIAAFLKSNGVSASFYHAGLGTLSRTERQGQWKSGTIRVMVCTNAFGMGIDKPDVRFVVHFDVPDSPEAYFQEAGRAGRDGKRSYAVLLWNSGDVRRLRQTASVSFPTLEYVEDIYHKVHMMYGIPYDVGKGMQLKFDLHEFCIRYGLNRSSAWYAIKYIEREGHWTVMEDVDVQTKVMFIVPRTALYDMPLPEEKMAAVAEVLMRRYTGLFSFPVPVDEQYVADRTGTSVPELRQLLYRMSLEHLIKYIPGDHTTVIYLNEDRLMPKNVRLTPERHDRLKSTYVGRMETMVKYVEETETCRSRFLLSYFGQTESEDCGTCDICRRRHRDLHHGGNNSGTDSAGGNSGTGSTDGNSGGCKEARKPAARLLREEISSYILEEKGGSYTLNDINARFGNPVSSPDKTYLDELRDMIDEGAVPPYIV